MRVSEAREILRMAEQTSTDITGIQIESHPTAGIFSYITPEIHCIRSLIAFLEGDYQAAQIEAQMLRQRDPENLEGGLALALVSAQKDITSAHAVLSQLFMTAQANTTSGSFAVA